MSPSRPYRDAAGKTLTDYPRPSVAVDTAVLTVPDGADTVHVLLVRRAGSHEKGAWALPGTFLHDGETLADAVLRSLRDKAGVQGLAPRQLHVFDDPHRDDRGWVLSVAHLDVVPWPRIAPAATAREDVHLVAVDEAIGLPFDHDAIVTRAVSRAARPLPGAPRPGPAAAQPVHAARAARPARSRPGPGSAEGHLPSTHAAPTARPPPATARASSASPRCSSATPEPRPESRPRPGGSPPSPPRFRRQ